VINATYRRLVVDSPTRAAPVHQRRADGLAMAVLTSPPAAHARAAGPAGRLKCRTARTGIRAGCAEKRSRGRGRRDARRRQAAAAAAPAAACAPPSAPRSKGTRSYLCSNTPPLPQRARRAVSPPPRRSAPGHPGRTIGSRPKAPGPAPPATTTPSAPAPGAAADAALRTTRHRPGGGPAAPGAHPPYPPPPAPGNWAGPGPHPPPAPGPAA
jgi:hypothetical protein